MSVFSGSNLAPRQYLAYLPAVFFCALSAWLIFRNTTSVHESPSDRMAKLAFSRTSIEGVEFFKDESLMHGPKFFNFVARPPDIERLVKLLDLRQRGTIPEFLRSRIDYAKSSVKWKFNWSTNTIYSIYYCNPSGADLSFDVALVDGNRVVYVTSGYKEDSAVKVDDPSSCGETIPG